MTSAAQPSAGKRYAFLDGLRGIAIIGVIVIHGGHIFPGKWPIFEHLSVYGGRGVQLFFVVSGLTLTLNYAGKKFEFQPFYFRRFFRIAPMFYLGMAIYIALGQFTMLSSGASNPSAIKILSTLTFLHGWSPYTIHSIVPGGWSIAAEMMFYLVFPIALAGLRAPKWFLFATLLSYPVAFVVIRLALHVYPAADVVANNWNGFFWLSQLPAFLTGCSLALLLPYWEARPMLAKVTFYGAILALILAATFAPGALLAAFLLGWLTLGAAGVRPAWLESPFLTSIGDVSFSIYILHFMFVSLIELIAPDIARQVGPNVGFLLSSMIVFIVSYPLSLLTYARIEKPMIRFGKRLLRPPELHRDLNHA